MKVAYDSTKFIQSSIDEVEKTLGEAVLIVVVVIFLFLASIRSVVIPVVTIPLSLVGVCSLMLVMGFSINLLTLLAMVLAIGLVVDDAIVVVENIHRHLEEGKTPVQASLQGAREIVGPVISMTITLAAVYAPIGFLGGLTGSLFREFAFTLAGSVIVSGVIALTLSPMMCSIFLKNADEGRFARLVNHVFGSMTRWYGRKLDRSLDYRPITGLFALTILGLVGFLYMHTSKELAPDEDQGIVFAVTKAPKYANIDYIDFYGEKLDKEFQKFPETDLRFILNGINGPQGGIAGMLLKPWDERKRSSIALKPLVQAELSKIEGVQAFAFNEILARAASENVIAVVLRIQAFIDVAFALVRSGGRVAGIVIKIAKDQIVACAAVNGVGLLASYANIISHPQRNHVVAKFAKRDVVPSAGNDHVARAGRVQKTESSIAGGLAGDVGDIQVEGVFVFAGVPFEDGLDLGEGFF